MPKVKMHRVRLKLGTLWYIYNMKIEFKILIY